MIGYTPIPGANTPPTISTISNQTVRVNHSTGALPFTIGDAQDPASSLTLREISSDTSVIPDASVGFGGSGGSRTVTVTAGNQTGTSIITVTVNDGQPTNNTFSRLFVVNVRASVNANPTIAGPFTNRTVIEDAIVGLRRAFAPAG